MKLTQNPYVKAELDNLQLQFGNKALLTMDDYCALFHVKRKKASCHVHSNNVPHIKERSRILFSILDLALYLAQKKIGKDKPQIVAPTTSEDMKNRRGFRAKAIEAQLRG